jgi:hypothetical protein
MALFEVGKPITTTDSTVSVDVDATHALSVGPHRFQLVVVDESGNQSQPVTVDVIVKDTVAPTAVLEVLGPVTFNQPFTLSGQKSLDNGGDSIVSYIWTLVDQQVVNQGIPVIEGGNIHVVHPLPTPVVVNPNLVGPNPVIEHPVINPLTPGNPVQP